MRNVRLMLVLVLVLLVGTACYPPALPASAPASTPTPDPDIYNKVPKTTVYNPGECTAVLTAPAPAYTSNGLASPPTGEIPAGQYEVGVVADYGSSIFYGFNNVGTTNYVKSTSVSSLTGACATKTN